MSEALRKGWCPGALRPMAAKDGLIVRLRITGGILPSVTAHAIADLAARFGNGLLDLSARGNLQLRGIGEAALGPLQDGLHEIGLLDADAAAESVRNVIASPLAGLHDGLDVRRLTVALERRLVEDAALHTLPGKFGFLIDDGTWPSLAGIAADIRFDWLAEERAFSIGLGGNAASALRVGVCGADDMVERAAALARNFLTSCAGATGVRRMRDALDLLERDGMVRVFGGPGPEMDQAGPWTVARDLVGRWDRGARLPVWETPQAKRAVPDEALSRTRDPSGTVRSSALRTAPPARREGGHAWLSSKSGKAGRVSCVGLAAPFGRLTTDMLRALADLGELRLTPWRVILAPRASDVPDIPGFITDPGDPRLAVAACVGAAGCGRGSTDTHADAARVAAVLPRQYGEIAIHVSGCEKGCAKPSPTTSTLVGRDGHYDLVRHGRAGDPPAMRGLDLAAAIAALHAVAEPA